MGRMEWGCRGDCEQNPIPMSPPATRTNEEVLMAFSFSVAIYGLQKHSEKSCLKRYELQTLLSPTHSCCQQSGSLEEPEGSCENHLGRRATRPNDCEAFQR